MIKPIHKGEAKYTNRPYKEIDTFENNYQKYNKIYIYLYMIDTISDSKRENKVIEKEYIKR